MTQLSVDDTTAIRGWLSMAPTQPYGVSTAAHTALAWMLNNQQWVYQHHQQVKAMLSHAYWRNGHAHNLAIDDELLYNMRLVATCDDPSIWMILQAATAALLQKLGRPIED